MATPLNFGKPLKFGPDSYLNAKGRPTFLHQERENTRSSARNTHAYTSRGALQRGPACAGAVNTAGG